MASDLSAPHRPSPRGQVRPLDVDRTSPVPLYFQVATRLQERLPLSAYKRPLLGTGLCGALTTFSTMQLELLRMLDRGSAGLALGYAGASVVAGFGAVWLATAMVRRVRVVA